MLVLDNKEDLRVGILEPGETPLPWKHTLNSGHSWTDESGIFILSRGLSCVANTW